MRVRKVVIPAAGLGERFYPLTRAQPKEMLPILDRPIIHYVVDEAVRSGLDQILIVVGKGKDAIINYFDKHELDSRLDSYGISKLPEIFFVRQREPRGLADAVRCAESFVGDEPFVVLVGDTIYRSGQRLSVTQQLLNAYYKREAPVLAIERVPKEKISDYGIIEGRRIDSKLWLIKDMVEKPRPESAPSNMGIIGMYVLTQSVFGYIKRIKRGRNNEYQLTDALRLMCRDMNVYGYEFDGKRYDMGTKRLWIDAFVEFARENRGAFR